MDYSKGYYKIKLSKTNIKTQREKTRYHILQLQAFYV